MAKNPLHKASEYIPDELVDRDTLGRFSQNPHEHVNDCISRIEAVKLRLLGNLTIPEEEKYSLLHELDTLRAAYLHMATLIGTSSLENTHNAHESGVEYLDHYPDKLEIEGIMGTHPEIQNNLYRISRIAPTKLSVLLEGETGSGKEMFARIIHHNSNRHKLVAVNCGAISQGLIESELFGHMRGSFTGATSDRKGKFEEASGGTIFLDEIGELELQAQVRLLRVLDGGEIQRVGSDKTIKSDVRVIAATNRSLEQMVENGTFREDLFYRLTVCHLHIPPLRERRDEIELLFEFFVKKTMQDNKIPKPELSEKLRRFLFRQYEFPGNIRELRNIALYITHIGLGEKVDIGDMPDKYRTSYAAFKQQGGTRQTNIRKSLQDDAEREYIESMLKKNRGNVKETCEDLQLSRSRIYQLMKKHGLQAADYRSK